MRLRSFLCLLITALPFLGYGQITDDFSDMDFTSNPTWSGDVAKFVINSDTTMQSNGSPVAADTMVLTVPTTSIDSTEWRFYMKLEFNPTSTGNYVKVYLVSDNADLSGSLNGYYVRIGETGSSDTLELFKQTGLVETKILTGSTAFGSTTNATIKVTRDNLGNWSLYTDPSAGSNFNFEGSVNDLDHTTTSFFGVYCKYSTFSRFDQYHFDDFYIGPILGDTVPPTIVSAVATSDTTVDVTFSEVVDKTTAETTANYSADNGLGNPSSALRDTLDSSIVHLTFSTTLGNGILNTLTVNNVQDNSGNAITVALSTFLYFIPAAAVKMDIIINEILPDPSPPIGLPEAEFVELYNTSTKVFDLSGWQFVNSATSKVLLTHLLLPDAYVILCDEADTTLFSPYGDVIGVSGFSALTNDGDSLTLLDNGASVIDIVAYDESWYNDITKEDDGWSIERINPITSCSFANNWTASINPDGGTPGFKNSVYDTLPDSLAPSLSYAKAFTSTMVRVYFSEGMDSSALAFNNYTIDNGVTVSSAVVNSLDFTSFDLTLSTPLNIGIVYTVSVNAVSDCSGNIIGGINSAQFLIPFPAVEKDIIINEILPDPSPPISLPDAEFVELYNTSAKVFDLNGWKFVNSTTDQELVTHLLLPNAYVILCDEDDMALFASYGDVMGISGFSALTNGGDSLTLLDNGGSVIDIVAYEDTWYNDLTKDDGGWSIELINPNLPCSYGNNWTASKSFFGGTPGFKNSAFDTLPDTLAPSLSSALALSTTQIRLTFSESMDSLTVAFSIYTITPAIAVSSVQVSTSDITKVDLTLGAALDTGTVYTVKVSTVSDCSGNSIGANDTAQFLISYDIGRYDILITEIFADPTPSIGLPEFEYVEYYNNSSNAFNFFNESIFFPGEYIIRCSEAAGPSFEPYGKVLTKSDFGTLSNAGDTWTLLFGGEIVHSVTYSDTWYDDSDKKDGGWSLEIIDVNNPCEEENNWRASVDPSGGTPGKENSIKASNPDLSAPMLLRADAADTLNVYLTFNEVPDTNDLKSATYSVNKGIIIDTLVVESTKSVKLTFTTNILPNTIYTVTVTGLRDCVGNLIGTSNNAPFALPEQGLVGDVIINEILSNPTSNGSDFVEVYNNS
ncbi:MAG: lamin tail domain-containing protein, partial [Flavobacteriales bacterium]|nr:lamin tail domain-containing protein [Flavobacteriales bacterium]